MINLAHLSYNFSFIFVRSSTNFVADVLAKEARTKVLHYKVSWSMYKKNF